LCQSCNSRKSNKLQSQASSASGGLAPN
jgi:hypothetical protein